MNWVNFIFLWLINSKTLDVHWDKLLTPIPTRIPTVGLFKEVQIILWKVWVFHFKALKILLHKLYLLNFLKIESSKVSIIICWHKLSISKINITDKPNLNLVFVSHIWKINIFSKRFRKNKNRKINFIHSINRLWVILIKLPKSM